MRNFIAIAEKELELYYRHIALYGDPNDEKSISVLDGPTNETEASEKHKLLENQTLDSASDFFSTGLLETESDSSDSELLENFEDDN